MRLNDGTEANQSPIRFIILGSTCYTDMQEVYRKMSEGHIEWCCKRRHGAIRDVTEDEWNDVANFLIYFFGSKCYHTKKHHDKKLWDVEFVHMTKVFPPPRQPWEWCGKTILFEELRKQREAAYTAAQAFAIGDKVAFDYKGYHEGIVAGVNRRVTVISGNQKYYISAKDLKKL